MQPQKHVVHVEGHASMELPEPEIPTESQIPGEALDQVWHPKHDCVSQDPVQEETEVLEPQQLPIVPPQPKSMVLEQPLPQVLPMTRPMLLPYTLPVAPDQPVPFQGSIN